MFNAQSTIFPHLEPYLNKVMGRCINELGDTDEELRAEAKTFIQQETNHYRTHRSYNQRLYDAGYEGVKEFESALHDEYRDWLKSRSLKFNLAYSEGFESMGVIYSFFFIDMIDDLLVGAEPEVVRLWKWHLAEEFEHRNVCHRMYKRLYGGYFYRVYGSLYAIIHLGKYGAAAGQWLIEKDRIGLDEAGLRESKKRFWVFQLRILRFFLPRIFKIWMPWYTPEKLTVTPKIQHVLDAYAPS